MARAFPVHLKDNAYHIAGNIKFGSLAVYITTAKLKPAKISYSHIYVWRSCTAKFKSANILAIAILGSTAKFNYYQYFRLYGNSWSIIATSIWISNLLVIPF